MITEEIYTSKVFDNGHYMVEVKTTSSYAKEFKLEAKNSDYTMRNLSQLNLQMGVFGRKQGILHKINTSAFLAKYKEGDEGMFDYHVWSLCDADYHYALFGAQREFCWADEISNVFY